MSNIISPRAYLKTALHNGVGRYVCQLQRVTLKFNKHHGGSRGIREYIEKDLADFVRANPGVVIYLKPRRTGAPSITAEFLNGESDYKSFPRNSREEIVKWVEYMRNRSGFPIARFIKHIHTDNPSIQGPWTPYMNKPSYLNVTTFPDQHRSEIKSFFPSATEQLLELAKTYGTDEKTESNVQQ